MKLPAGLEKHKGVVIGGGIGLLGFGVYVVVKRRSAGSSAGAAQTPGQYLTPDQLVASPTGSILTLGGSTGSPDTFVSPPGSQPAPGGAGASGVATASTPTPQVTQASLLGFTNAQTPVALIGGKLIDTGTGRVAYYGPNGQPGSASSFSGASSYTDITGKEVYYNPTGYSYADTSRAPDLPPVHAVGFATQH